MLKVTDRPVGSFRPSTDDTAPPPHPHPLQSTVSITCRTARPAYRCRQPEAVHTAQCNNITVRPPRPPSECHIVAFDEFSVVCFLAEIQPTLNHTKAFYASSSIMSPWFQVQHESVFAQLFTTMSTLMEFRESCLKLYSSADQQFIHTCYKPSDNQMSIFGY